MKLQVLGCAGAIAQGSYTSSFVVDGCVAFDAGTGLGQLSLEQMQAIDHVFITHAHLDHIAALPLFLDSVMVLRAQQNRPPVQVYALAETLHVLRKHIFNRVIWPDFTVLPSRQNPVVALVPIVLGQVIALPGLAHQVEALPAEHTVPSIGFAISPRAGAPALVYTGDTGPNPMLWQRLAQMPIAALIIETAFASSEAGLARAALHLSPATLKAELLGIDPQSSYPIYITHTKPAQAASVRADVQQMLDDDAELRAIIAQHPLNWLRCGQILTIG